MSLPKENKSICYHWLKWNKKSIGDWKEIKVLWNKCIYVATIWLMSLSKDDIFICNHYDWLEIKGTEGWNDVRQMNLCKVNMIEMKSMYCGLEWNRIIVIDIWILYDCVSVKREII